MSEGRRNSRSPAFEEKEFWNRIFAQKRKVKT